MLRANHVDEMLMPAGGEQPSHSNVCGQAGLRCECSLVRMADRKHPNLGTKLNLLPNSVSGGEFRMHARNREVTFAVLDTK
jgi:hypothetical protein